MDLLVNVSMVILINIVLSGDNAIVIALACRALPPDQKKKAIIWGSGLAVAFRIILVGIATYLLQIPFLQFIGGLALVYIGYQLLAADDDYDGLEASNSFWIAVKAILAADLIMSLDNVLAIAGVAKGDWLILILGLAISIPLVIFGAQILTSLMNRFPIVVYIGAGLIAWTAAEMMCGDKMIGHFIVQYALILKIVITGGVLVIGYMRKPKPEKETVKESTKPAN
ncbi:MAG: TerC family protein [Firmicutes bacterium]|nr:TerC family protein [Bacillota bacterium]